MEESEKKKNGIVHSRLSMRQDFHGIRGHNLLNWDLITTFTNPTSSKHRETLLALHLIAHLAHSLKNLRESINTFTPILYYAVPSQAATIGFLSCKRLIDLNYTEIRRIRQTHCITSQGVHSHGRMNIHSSKVHTKEAVLWVPGWCDTCQEIRSTSSTK